MSDAERKVQQARAARLRKQIDRLTTPQAAAPEPTEKESPPARESPREFIQRRMRELGDDPSKAI